MHDPQQLVGQTLAGKYQVKRLIGQGGMGAVYEGSNVEIGKRVAIKTIDQGHAMSQELATRLKREARAAAAVESSHIVQVFDVGEDPKCGVFMVMEFLQGEDLASRLAREGRLDAATATLIGVQVGRALTKAHAAGIVHRDLKPGNVFLCEREEGGLLVKVVDFGISKLLRDDVVGEQRNLTRMGTALGTPQYMSPEQASGNQEVDQRTDVWALGCLLFEMLAGKPPYDDAGSYELTIVRILTTRPPPLLGVAPWVSPALAAIVDRALGYEWAARTPDVVTIVRQLSEAANLDVSTGRFSAINVPAYGATPSGAHDVLRPAPYAPTPSTSMGIGVPRASSADLGATLPLTSSADLGATLPLTSGADLGATLPLTSGADLGATLPMNDHLAAEIAQARAQVVTGPYAQQPQPPSGGYPLPSHPSGSGSFAAVPPVETGLRKPISTATAVVVAPSYHGARSPEHEPESAAGVPTKSSSALLFVGIGAVVAALGVGAFFVLGGSSKESEKNTPGAQPVQTTSKKAEGESPAPKDTPKEEPSAPATTATATTTTTTTTTTTATGAIAKPAKSPAPSAPTTAKTAAVVASTKSEKPPLTKPSASTAAVVAAPTSTTPTSTNPPAGTTGKGLGGAGVTGDY
jgi:serine/threonine-protein kinase